MCDSWSRRGGPETFFRTGSTAGRGQRRIAAPGSRALPGRQVRRHLSLSPRAVWEGSLAHRRHQAAAPWASPRWWAGCGLCGQRDREADVRRRDTKQHVDHANTGVLT